MSKLKLRDVKWALAVFVGVPTAAKQGWAQGLAHQPLPVSGWAVLERVQVAVGTALAEWMPWRCWQGLHSSSCCLGSCLLHPVFPPHAEVNLKALTPEMLSQDLHGDGAHC